MGGIYAPHNLQVRGGNTAQYDATKGRAAEVGFDQPGDVNLLVLIYLAAVSVREDDLEGMRPVQGKAVG